MTDLPKALLIEDDPSTIFLIKSALSPLIQLTPFTSGKEAIHYLENQTPNIILLDLNLPDTNGIQLLQLIRSIPKFKMTPILIITSSSSPQDELLGHEYGVTEYLKKPIVPELIKMIVEKNLAVSMSNNTELLIFNQIRVNLSTMTAAIEIEGALQDLNLTQKELKILIYLLQNKQRVLSKEKIYEKVWNVDSDSLLRTVEMHISSLRKKLGPYSVYLKTIRGTGYIIKK